MLPTTFAAGKTDNQILAVVRHLQKQYAERPVVLVSKDINMRIKARALGLAAEDYFNDKVLEDTDVLYTGVHKLAADFWDAHGRDMESWKKEGHTYYRVRGPLVPQLLLNEFVYDDSGERPLYATVKEKAGRMAVLETVRDYTHAKNSVWGITARNREQNFALNLLMNPAVDFVTLLGQAGTGKTLLTHRRRPHAGARREALHRDHHDAGDGSRSARTSASCPAPRRRRCSPGWARWRTTSTC